ncbi:hypothetical protein TVAGG3_1016450 [Trichomonas vaginalis G3]|uniref:hypothetical protein n=1 Tax=Trichomonas vaginalis (strain ATCC PRA-98 / G3) TaxID=412133 RepID=UPI0021E5B1D9|nr:hypothetical protein TVAGG3_1016450 [Trichomonas vaginalis G3]KAI5491847.1 hypothetical protein TVAGG3_1016450 [Trichomonas vaginalis G3]
MLFVLSAIGFSQKFKPIAPFLQGKTRKHTGFSHRYLKPSFVRIPNFQLSESNPIMPPLRKLPYLLKDDKPIFKNTEMEKNFFTPNIVSIHNYQDDNSYTVHCCRHHKQGDAENGYLPRLPPITDATKDESVHKGGQPKFWTHNGPWAGLLDKNTKKGKFILPRNLPRTLTTNNQWDHFHQRQYPPPIIL